jgi:BirA family transcriptional regulator, biotin operon repressor / biotin---[acetyl-CoA-carboxylase] ligase
MSDAHEVDRASRFRLGEVRAGAKPLRLHWFARVGSTNDQAARMRRRRELFAPAMVLTGNQSSGRGRGEHRWWSAKGCLTVTFVLAAEEGLMPQQVALVAGLAAREVAARMCGRADVLLKWPNDVVWEGRKLAGLLCERVDGVDLVGVGLNVNLGEGDAPRGLREKVVSLSRIGGRVVDINHVLIELAGELRRRMVARKVHLAASFVGEYERHHWLSGRRVRVETGAGGGGVEVVEGWCEGIDQLGRLLVRDGRALRRVVTGRVVKVGGGIGR